MTTQQIIQSLRDPNTVEINSLKPSCCFYSKVNFNQEYLIDLNGKWEFTYKNDFFDRDETFYLKKHLEQKIIVPGHIELSGYGNIQYVNTQYPWDGKTKLIPPNFLEESNPTGQYLRKFEINTLDTNNQYILNFDGVELCFNVWLNGVYIGYGEDSHTRTQFDISPWLKKGYNFLAVEVYKYGSAIWLEDQDQWRLFGIHRSVYITLEPKYNVKDVNIKTRINFKLQSAIIDLKIKLNSPCEMTVVIKDPSQDVVYKSISYFNKDNLISIELDRVKIWSDEFPYLYTLELTTSDQISKVRFGIKEIKIKNNIILINEKKIILNGINRHEFHSKKGRAIGEEEMLFDIRFMKKNNINAVRCSHYPNQNRWYQLCDEYGIYVIDEVNLETHGTWQKMGIIDHQNENIVPHDNKIWEKAVLSRGASMYEQHKNHVSIIMWSCGNESYTGEIFQSLSAYLKSVDSTRLVHYEGVVNNREYKNISDVESRMYAMPEDVISYCWNDPEKPMILCEYSHSMGNSNGGLDKYQELIHKCNNYHGGFIWEYIEHGLEYGPLGVHYGGDYDDRPTDYNFVIDGLIKYDRSYSPKVLEVKYTYQPFKIKIFPTSFEIKNYHRFKNLSSYEIKINIFKNGNLSNSQIITLDCNPDQSRNYDFSNLCDEESDFIRIEVQHKEDGLYYKKGDEIGFEEKTVYEKRDLEKPVNNEHSTLEVIEGDVNIGVRMNSLMVQFHKSLCKITSMNISGKELLHNGRLFPGPTFFRAPTDNDYGAQKDYEMRQWELASKYQKGKSIKINKSQQGIVISTVLEIGTVPSTQIKVDYHFTNYNFIEVSMSYKGHESLPPMYRFGFDSHLKKELSNMTWYGKGPGETYQDRKKGSKTNIYVDRVDDQFTYTYPQTFGNKTDVRWIEILDDNGNGLRYESNELFEASVKKYSEITLSNADHQYELPHPFDLYFVIDKEQIGVGGNNSWGSWIDPGILDLQEGTINFVFKIIPKKGKKGE